MNVPMSWHAKAWHLIKSAKVQRVNSIVKVENMVYLGLLLSAIFLILSAIHLYWACGGTTGKNLAIPVKANGERSFTPSAIGTFLVGVALLLFAVLAYCLSVMQIGWIRPLGWVLALMLLMRAIGDFKLVGFFKKPAISDFAKYDGRFFSPLCLFLAAGVLYISL